MASLVTAFKGGDRLSERLQAILGKVNSADRVDVGFLEGATYPDGTSVPMVAAIQEFGAPSRGIPPRPFFRGMIAKNSPNWGKELGAIMKATNCDAAAALALMGDNVKGQLQASIKDTNDPPLAPSTVKAKGFAKPLIDTGHMMNSVDYQVHTK